MAETLGDVAAGGTSAPPGPPVAAAPPPPGAKNSNEPVAAKAPPKPPAAKAPKNGKAKPANQKAEPEQAQKPDPKTELPPKDESQTGSAARVMLVQAFEDQLGEWWPAIDHSVVMASGKAVNVGASIKIKKGGEDLEVELEMGISAPKVTRTKFRATIDGRQLALFAT